jgi:hypothetical protein
LNVIADLIGVRCKLAADKARKIADEIGQALEQTGLEAAPRCRWENLRIAVTNSASLLALLGILVTAAVLYLTWDYIGCVPGKCLPSLGLPGLLVAGWIVVPPGLLLIELYLRDGGEADRQMLKTYRDYARTIWLALGAVLAAIYGLALKPGDRSSLAHPWAWPWA